MGSNDILSIIINYTIVHLILPSFMINVSQQCKGYKREHTGQNTKVLKTKQNERSLLFKPNIEVYGTVQKFFRQECSKNAFNNIYFNGFV